MKDLPEDIIYFIINSYLDLEHIHKTIVYKKYWKQANTCKYKQVQLHFPQQLQLLGINELISDESYTILKNKMICINIIAAFIRMKKRKVIM